VEWCIERLTECNARIVVTALPVHSLERLSPWQYRFFRSLLFPSRRLTWEQAIERAQTVNRLLRDLCAERGIALIEQQREWYGVDPIHIHRRRRASAYHEILKHWLGPGCDAPPVARMDFRDGWRLQFLLPQCQSLLGFEWQRKQPCGWLPDGSTISLY
jgi:hypothetical protein